MNQANINLKLPPEWLENLQELASKNNQSTHELILEILANYLNIDYSNFEGKQIRAEIEELKARFKQLEQKDYQFTRLNERLNILEELIISLQSQVISPKASPDLSTLDDDDEEIYDEPDEILTDFLPH